MYNYNKNSLQLLKVFVQKGNMQNVEKNHFLINENHIIETPWFTKNILYYGNLQYF